MQPLVENSMETSQKTENRKKKKLKTELSYDPAIPLLSIYQRKKKNNPKTLIQKDIGTPVSIAAPFTIAKI